MKRIFACLTFLLLLAGQSLWAQAPQYSQFYAAPTTFNPALTGAFNGRYRLALIYRDQWRNALEDPNSTYAAAVDLRIPMRLNRNQRTDDALGVGLIFNSDKFATVGFSNNQIGVSAAYHKALSPLGDQFLTLGVQFSVNQRNFNFENITFEDQFNGSDGFTRPTSEFLPENNFTFSDLAVGLNYTYAPSNQLAVYTGLAIHHLTEPQVSFFTFEDVPEDERGDSKLFRRYSAHASLSIPVSNQLRISPRLLGFVQGPHLSFNAGSNFRFLFNAINGTALHLGAYIRPVRNEEDQLDPNAAILMTGIEINNLLIGLSYDANLDDLSASSTRRNVFEISIALLGNQVDEAVLCPKF